MDSKSEPFAIVHRSIIEDGEISANALRVYCCLARYADRKTGEAFPSNEKLLELLPMSKDTFFTAKALLVKLGYVVERKARDETGKFARNVYLLPLIRGEAPCPKNSDTAPCPKKSDSPCPKNSDSPCPDFSDTIIPESSYQKSYHSPLNPPKGKKKRKELRRRRRNYYDPKNYELSDPHINPFEEYADDF